MRGGQLVRRACLGVEKWQHIRFVIYYRRAGCSSRHRTFTQQSNCLISDALSASFTTGGRSIQRKTCFNPTASHVSRGNGRRCRAGILDVRIPFYLHRCTHSQTNAASLFPPAAARHHLFPQPAKFSQPVMGTKTDYNAAAAGGRYWFSFKRNEEKKYPSPYQFSLIIYKKYNHFHRSSSR